MLLYFKSGGKAVISMLDSLSFDSGSGGDKMKRMVEDLAVMSGHNKPEVNRWEEDCNKSSQ